MAKRYNIQFTIQVPVLTTAAERREIGRRAIEHIVNRSRNKHEDKYGADLKQYTKGYIGSLDFRNLKSSKVPNLTLTGDLLDALDIVSDGEGYVDIGYPVSSSEADKAEGNILGTYGQQRPTGKARDFLGFAGPEKKQLDKIIKDVMGATPEEKAAIQIVNAPSTEDQLNAILNNVGVANLE